MHLHCSIQVAGPQSTPGPCRLLKRQHKAPGHELMGRKRVRIQAGVSRVIHRCALFPGPIAAPWARPGSGCTAKADVAGPPTRRLQQWRWVLGTAARSVGKLALSGSVWRQHVVPLKPNPGGAEGRGRSWTSDADKFTARWAFPGATAPRTARLRGFRSVTVRHGAPRRLTDFGASHAARYFGPWAAGLDRASWDAALRQGRLRQCVDRSSVVWSSGSQLAPGVYRCAAESAAGKSNILVWRRRPEIAARAWQSRRVAPGRVAGRARIVRS